jgi:ABC-type uncharacterized transport system substrate-binding protein
VRRRNFITVIGGAAVLWPFVTRAQQQAIRLIGFLGFGSPADYAQFLDGFRRGLGEMGFAEGQNVVIEYRWAAGQPLPLPSLVDDLVKRGVEVIVAGGPPAAAAAKAATSSIPIVFLSGEAVALGLVDSFSHPTGNLTGVSVFGTPTIWGKRVELAHEAIPRAAKVAMLLSPNEPGEPDVHELLFAAEKLGMKLFTVSASTEAEIEPAFAAAKRQKADALLVSDKPFFTVRRAMLVALATRYSLPAIYAWPDYPAAGGLMSYGSNLSDAWHQVGIYAARILKGAKPSELPVQQPTKVELVINLRTASALGLSVPPSLLAQADEVIE